MKNYKTGDLYLRGKGAVWGGEAENWKGGQFYPIFKKAEICLKAEDSHPCNKKNAHTHQVSLKSVRMVKNFLIMISGNKEQRMKGILIMFYKNNQLNMIDEQFNQLHHRM